METLNEFNHSEQFISSFASVQKEIENLSKEKKGYNYKYAELSQVTELLLPLTSKNNLCVTQLPTVVENKVYLETYISSLDGGFLKNTLVMEIENGKGMSSAQKVGSVITYARRYSLTAIFGIAQEDDDGSQRDRALENSIVTKMRQIVDSVEDKGVQQQLNSLDSRSLKAVFEKYSWSIDKISNAVLQKLESEKKDNESE
jgi:hypothetical protein